MSLYTKKGDTGFTSTMNRMMIEKSSPVFYLLGTLDEFTSALGMAKPWVPAQLLEIVRQIQNDVILLSEEIAGGPRFATHERVASLEKAVDSVSETLPQHFETQPGGALGPAVPGASKAGAALDLARAIVRRAEREAVPAVEQTIRPAAAPAISKMAQALLWGGRQRKTPPVRILPGEKRPAAGIYSATVHFAGSLS